LLEAKYDFIVCCEVIEHFHNPRKEFLLLRKLLFPKGKLYCATNLYTNEIDFSQWYYKNDFTHTFFYATETIEWIKKKLSFSSATIDNRLITFSHGL
jgi:2-polyprenyl-3-methyl-5-hydroxy-6-metoxy-1,4-benzoquinol methylase